MATPPVPPPVPGPNKLMTPAPAPGTLPPPPQPADVQKQATVDEAPGEGDLPLERSFWQIPFVQDILPFLTSLVLHLGLIGLGILLYKTAEKMGDVTIVPTVIPSEVIIEGA